MNAHVKFPAIPAFMWPAKAKAADRRAVALQRYENACALPDRYDWRGVADMLASVIPLPRPKPVDIPELAPGIEWTDYAIPNSRKIVWPSPLLLVEFSDGRSLRVGAASLAGKPVNWGRAVRHAVNWYRSKIAKFVGVHGTLQESIYPWVNVPAIDSITADDGTQYPADIANRETAEQRAGSFDLYETLLEAHRRDLHWSATLLDGAADYMRQRFLEARNDHAEPGWRTAAEGARLKFLQEREAFWNSLPNPPTTLPRPCHDNAAAVVSLADYRAANS